ncbi:MAG: AAA family ATPase [Synergistaceae bacterium]|nr:AAA family ATPase [Synergistaceae bacterium]
METNAKFSWVEFYKELSNKLLTFKNNRQELIENVKRIFSEIDINLPTLEKDNNIVDIDPFTIIGLFNKSSMKDENRKKIIQSVAKVFEIKAPVPESFEGIPVLNNTNATFYSFIGDREDNDIDDIWNLFESALNYSSSQTPDKRDTFSKNFDIVKNKKGIGNSKLTMGLYWIAPDVFMSLDQRNTWYIYETGKLEKSFVETLPLIEKKISASKYFDIIEKIRNYLQSDDSELKNFMELSFASWIYSEQVNREKKDNKTPQNDPMADKDIEITHYWIYSPGENAKNWNECLEKGIMSIGWDEIGDLRQYQSKTGMQNALQEEIDPDKTFTVTSYATWQFVHDLKPGDVVFAKKGMSIIIGRGEVVSDYEFDDSRDDYKNVRKVEWTHHGEWKYPAESKAPMKTLTDITPYNDIVEQLKALFGDVKGDEDEKVNSTYPPYNKNDFLNDVYLDESSYETLTGLLLNRKNIILQGAPGVGKTFAAKRLAFSIMKEKDIDRIMMIQFHQSYSYEDFIMGFRPSEKGFELRTGTFYNFCKKAEVDSGHEYFFIIDEINRGNLSKIFGELFMLIEKDKRDVVKVQLLYSNETFSVPDNVYIIGMMNTADRSLAMLDYALRRRFAFYEIKPAFNSEGFRNYQKSLNSTKFDNLIQNIEQLNIAIAEDESLGEGFCIGHSYFCNLTEINDNALSNILEYEIIPLLKEYWFDDPAKVKNYSEILRRSIK